MAVAWPHVKAWVVGQLPGLAGAGWTVYAGPPTVNAAPKKYITVGFVADDSGGTYSQAQDGDGSVTAELGEVRLHIVAQSGSSGEASAEADAFAVADALDTYIRANRRLGTTLSPEGTSDTAVEVRSVTNANGTATSLVYMLRYSTVT